MTTTTLITDTLIKRMHVGRQVLSADRLVYDSNGCAVSARTITGYYSSPGTNGDIIKNANGRGSWAAPFTDTERTLGIDGAIFAPDRVSLLQKIREIKSELPLEVETAFVFYEEDCVKHLRVLRTGEQSFDPKGKADGSGLIAPYSLSLVALDPMKLSGDGSDFTFRRETPYGQGGTLSYFNSGDEVDTPPTVFRVTDCVNPRFTQDGLTQSFTVSIPQGTYLEIDHETGSVLLVTYAPTGEVTDVQPARGYMNNIWLPLSTSTYDVTFVADSYGPQSQFELLSYDTFE